MAFRFFCDFKSSQPAVKNGWNAIRKNALSWWHETKFMDDMLPIKSTRFFVWKFCNWVERNSNRRFSFSARSVFTFRKNILCIFSIRLLFLFCDVSDAIGEVGSPAHRFDFAYGSEGPHGKIARCGYENAKRFVGISTAYGIQKKSFFKKVTQKTFL